MPRGPRSCAIILAGGSGRRAGTRKQFHRAGGRTLLYHSCAPFVQCREVGGLIVVVPRGLGESVTEELDDLGVEKLLAVVRGGATRNESARAGLAALPGSCELVLIHDAARPFASPRLIRRVLRAARENGAAVPAVALRDSIVELGRSRAGERLAGYVDRDQLRAVQTPQAFRREIIESAFARGRRRDFTDDAGAVIAAGGTVALVEGEPENWKITSADDLRRALEILETRSGV